MSRTEAASIEIGGGLANLALKATAQDTPSPDVGLLSFGALPTGGATCVSEPMSRRSPPLEEMSLTSDTDWQQWRAPDDVTPPAATSSQADDVTPTEGDVGATAAPKDSSGSNKTVFAGNIPFSASKPRLRELFEYFGPVTSVHLVVNPTNGRPRGYGFVTFRDASSADNCLAADLSSHLFLYKRQIRVSRAQPRRCSVLRSRHGTSAAAHQPAGVCHADRLPAELMLHIFSFLSLAEQLELQRVSRLWRETVRLLLARRQRLDLDECMSAWPERPLTDGRLRQLLRVMPALKYLRTGGHARSCSWKALDIVASQCKHLVDIDLDGFCINEASLKKLCTSCPDLETVQLPHQFHFSESSVWVLLRNLPRLRVLDLNRSDRVSGRSFSLLPSSLKRLLLSGCSGLQSSALRQLQRCPQLVELDVSGVTALQEADLQAALAVCPQLQRLTMRRLPLAPEKCLPDAGAPQLRVLDAAFSDGVTDASLRQLPDLAAALETLNIQGCSAVSEEGLTRLQRLHHLQTLDVSFVVAVTDEVLPRLGGHELHQLHLAEGFSGPARFTEDGVRRAVLDHPQLTLLDVSGVQKVTETLVSQLTDSLSAERDLVIYVGGTSVSLCDNDGGTWGDKPLRLKDTNTVPLHMRGYVDDDFDDSEYYDSDEFDFDDIDVEYNDNGMFAFVYDVEDYMYEAGYDEELDLVADHGIWRWGDDV